MDCKALTNDVFLDYGDRMLDKDARKPIDQHLNDCKNCRIRHEEVKRIGGAVRATLQAPAHQALMEQLDAAVLGSLDSLAAQRGASSARQRRFWAIGIGVAAAVLVAVIVGMMMGGQEKEQKGVVGVPIPKPLPEPAPRPEPPKREPPKPEPPAPEPPKPEVVKPEPPKPEPPRPEPPKPPLPESPRTKMPKEPVEPAPQPPKVDPPKPAPEPAFARGDFNRNRKLDAEDAGFLDREIRSGRTYDPATADLNGDGRVDCGDVLAILMAAERNP